MDVAHLTAFLQTLRATPSRRAVFTALIALGGSRSLAEPNAAEVGAKGKGKRKKKKKKQPPPPPPPPPPLSPPSPPPPPGGACSLTVQPGENLQAAIDAAVANGSATICLTAGTYALDRGFAETHDLDLNGIVSLLGVGPGQTILRGSGLRGVVECNSCSASLTGLTVTGGNFGPLEGVGGGIAFTGNLTMTNCTVSDNTAGDGGGIFGGDSHLVLDSCTITGNTAHREATRDGQGGGVLTLGALTRTNTTISGNTSDVGPDCSGTGC